MPIEAVVEVRSVSVAETFATPTIAPMPFFAATVEVSRWVAVIDNRVTAAPGAAIAASPRDAATAIDEVALAVLLPPPMRPPRPPDCSTSNVVAAVALISTFPASTAPFPTTALVLPPTVPLLSLTCAVMPPTSTA